MKKKIFFKILVVIITLVLLSEFVAAIFIEPWIGKKIDAELNKGNNNYIVKTDKVNISIAKSGLELKGITIDSKQVNEDDQELNAEIGSVKFNGINVLKAIFRHDIHIRSVTISNSIINGNIPFSGKARPPIISPLKVGIGRILFDNINIELKNPLTAQSFSLKEGVFKVYDFLVEKQDTLLPGTINLFDLKAKELVSVSSGNMYSYIVRGINYSATSNLLAID
ncbi:MAG: hypothetical protein HGA37_17995, partial [Lentimicrobium sp.]|nr:hypothetical protein [Lentimicrobium sp.]